MLNFVKKSVAIAAVLQASSALASPITNNDGSDVGFHNSVYFTNWGIYGRQFEPAHLPASKISHVLYSFLNLHINGTVFSSDPWADLQVSFSGDSSSEPGTNAYGCIKQLYLLKKKNRNMKTMLSIGGWTYSRTANFSVVAASEATRKTFAESSVGLMKDWGFDGIDVDWEYPVNATDADNYVKLLQAVRDELDSYSSQHADCYPFLLSIAAPAGFDNYKNLKMAELGQVVDHINLMAYDYTGGWVKNSGYSANIYPDAKNLNATPINTDAVVKAYIDGGVPPNKIILGMPIYGRSFQKTTDIGKPFSGVGSGSWEDGAWDYKQLPRDGATVVSNLDVIGAYSYDNNTQELISFDTPEIVSAKVKWLKEKGLGGSMFWEASADKKGPDSLISTSFNNLGSHDSTENLLDYPDSKFDNIRKGME